LISQSLGQAGKPLPAPPPGGSAPRNNTPRAGSSRGAVVLFGEAGSFVCWRVVCWRRLWALGILICAGAISAVTAETSDMCECNKCSLPASHQQQKSLYPLLCLLFGEAETLFTNISSVGGCPCGRARLRGAAFVPRCPPPPWLLASEASKCAAGSAPTTPAPQPAPRCCSPPPPLFSIYVYPRPPRCALRHPLLPPTAAATAIACMQPDLFGGICARS
jgi:hypothetical protein